MRWIREFLGDEDGQDVSEYAILIAAIALAFILGGQSFGNVVQAWLLELAAAIAGL
ncbi:MAG: hypothetical protein HY690_00500 [Chloroflexi bacterium]|nr:hypothetical protein [Chloroflexota bacterium]